jgi:hypothetical protein
MWLSRWQGAGEVSTYINRRVLLSIDKTNWVGQLISLNLVRVFLYNIYRDMEYITVHLSFFVCVCVMRSLEKLPSLGASAVELIVNSLLS